MNNLFDTLINSDLFAYSYHKLLLDSNDNPINYKYIDINEKFEDLVGLKKNQIIGKKVTDVLPKIKEDSFDWISFFAEVAFNNKTRIIQQYSLSLNRVFKIYAFSPKKGYFITFINDISVQIDFLKFPKKLLENSYYKSKSVKNIFKEIAFHLYSNTPSFAVLFNIYKKETKRYNVKSYACDDGVFDEFKNITKIDIDNLQWKEYKNIDKIISEGTISKFYKSLNELNVKTLKKSYINKLISKFNINQTVVVRIINQSDLIGHFVLFLSKKNYISNQYLIELYAQQIGAWLKKHKIEENFEKTKERLELAMEVTNNGIWDLNLDTDEVYYSPGYYKMLGYNPGEFPMIKESWENLMHPIDKKTVPDVANYHIEKALPYTIEFRLRCKDGTYKWIQGKGKSFKLDNKGRPHRVVGVHEDIDIRKKAEERLALALKGANAGLWDWNIKTGRTTFDDRWFGMLGYERSDFKELNYKLWEDLIHPDDIEETYKLLKNHLNGKTSFYKSEHRLNTKNGDWLWGLDSGKVVEWDENGNPLRMVGTHTDINDKKISENEKEKLIEKLQKSLDEINKLQDLLPICTNCKKIRKGDGYWESVDKYLAQHSDMKFSHGLCPDCMVKLYPDYSEDD